MNFSRSPVGRRLASGHWRVALAAGLAVLALPLTSHSRPLACLNLLMDRSALTESLRAFVLERSSAPDAGSATEVALIRRYQRWRFERELRAWSGWTVSRQEFSRLDIKRLTHRFVADLGGPSIWGKPQSWVRSRVEAQLAEMGLEQLLANQGRLGTNSRWSTSLADHLSRQPVQLALSAVSLASLFGPSPTPYAPALKEFRVSSADLDLFIRKGLNHPESQRRLNELADSQNSAIWYARFRSVFNPLAFTVGLTLFALHQMDADEEVARANGAALLKALHGALDDLDRQLTPNPFDTQFERARDLLEQKVGRVLSADELTRLCLKVPSPLHCSDTPETEAQREASGL